MIYKFSILVTLLFPSIVLGKFIAFADEKAVKDLKLPISGRSDLDSQLNPNEAANVAVCRRKNQHGAASGLRVPRIFTIPTIIFNTLGSVPGALTAALPSTPRETNEPSLAGADIVERKAPKTFASVTSTLTSAGPETLPLDLTKRGPNGEDLIKRCYNCFFNTCVPCSSGAGNLRIPRVFIVPTLLIKAASSIPRALGSAIPAATRSFLDRRQTERDESLERDKSDLEEINRSVHGPIAGRGAQRCVDGGHGRFICSAGSGLRAPRIFTVPSLLLSTLHQIPSALAAAIKPTSLGEHSSYISKRGSRIPSDVKLGQRFWSSTTNSRRPPRIFFILTLILVMLSSVPTTLALAIPHVHAITNSIASPDFEGVEKAVEDVKGMVFGGVKEGGG